MAEVPERYVGRRIRNNDGSPLSFASNDRRPPPLLDGRLLGVSSNRKKIPIDTCSGSYRWIQPTVLSVQRRSMVGLGAR